MGKEAREKGKGVEREEEKGGRAKGRGVKGRARAKAVKIAKAERMLPNSSLV